MQHATLLLALPALAAAFGAGRALPTQRATAVAAARGITPAPVAAARLSAFGSAVRMSTAESATAETYQFEAEVSRVMDIIVNSLYSNKDIFLRELISNASDACDKKRFLGLTDESAATAVEACIRVKTDKAARTITIEDMGVGMTREELRKNLGTIAQSGTKKFLEALKVKPDDSNLIGQFGVGFYSAFLVADKVTVVTKAAGGEQLRWESLDDKSGAYTIAADDGAAPIEGSSGTRVVLTLKPEMDEYLDDYRLRTLLATYGEFISFPVQLWAEKTTYEQVVDEAAVVEEGTPPPMTTVPKTVASWERVNNAKPIWMRPAAQVAPAEYAEFYKSAFRAWDEPLRVAHFSMEGQVEFRCLLFVPTSLPYELSQEMFAQAEQGSVRLYVKRVFISDRFASQVLPRWLSFIKVLIDSEDLPLNVSRELLQKSKVLSIIAKRVVRKALDQLLELAANADAEPYRAFYEQFGKFIKVGLIEDRDNKDELLKLARFSSSRAAVAAAAGEAAPDARTLVSLGEYVARMAAGQKQIYYVAGASKAALEGSPVLEALTAKGYEVLYALDSIDEIALQGIGEYQQMTVVDASKQNADLGDESEEAKAQGALDAERLAPVLAFLERAVGPAVERVELSRRLTASPAAIVQPQWGMSPQMERFMRAQAVALGKEDEMLGSMGAQGSTAILEINANHPVIAKLAALVAADAESPEALQFGMLVYEVAAVTSGYEIADPGAFAKRVTKMMADGQTMSAAAPAPAAVSSSGVTPVEIVE